MPATWSTYQSAMKEVWTDDHLVSQLYESTPFLDMLEKTEKYNVGEYAVVPITEYRSGGVTVTDTSGSSALNPAGNVGVRQATYSLVFDYNQVKVEHAAIMSTGGKPQAVAEVINTAGDQVSQVASDAAKTANTARRGVQNVASAAERS